MQSIKNSPTIIFLLNLVLLVSCNKTEQKEQATSQEVQKTPLEIVDKGLKAFPIDHETDFKRLLDLKSVKIGQREYFSFYNYNTHAIYLYDYETAELFKKVKMTKEGPNAVKVFLGLEYFFHTPDSIFINSMNHGIYLINDKGEVLQKRPDEVRPGQRKTANLKFDNTTRYVNGQLECRSSYSLLNIKDGDLHSRVIIDMNSDVIIKVLITERSFINDYDAIRKIEKEKGKGLIRMRQHFAKNDDYVFAATPISDSIYVFQGSKLVNTIYTGLPEHEIADYKTFMGLTGIEYLKNGMQRVSKPVQPAQYTGMYIDPDGRFIYRVLAHGTKPVYNEYLKKDMPKISGASMIVIDLETGEQIAYELPVEEIELELNNMPGSFFVSGAGVHFRVKEQENEDEVLYRVFGINKE